MRVWRSDCLDLQIVIVISPVRPGALVGGICLDPSDTAMESVIVETTITEAVKTALKSKKVKEC